MGTVLEIKDFVQERRRIHRLAAKIATDKIIAQFEQMKRIENFTEEELLNVNRVNANVEKNLLECLFDLLSRGALSRDECINNQDSVVSNLAFSFVFDYNVPLSEITDPENLERALESRNRSALERLHSAMAYKNQLEY